jgi:hypothetical protein
MASPSSTSCSSSPPRLSESDMRCGRCCCLWHVLLNWANNSSIKVGARYIITSGTPEALEFKQTWMNVLRVPLTTSHQDLLAQSILIGYTQDEDSTLKESCTAVMELALVWGLQMAEKHCNEVELPRMVAESTRSA